MTCNANLLSVLNVRFGFSLRAVFIGGTLAIVHLTFGGIPTDAKADAEAICRFAASVCAFTSHVVKVRVERRLMSGVYVGPGAVVTNRHALLDKETAVLETAGGDEYEARIVPTEFQGDLVLLSVQGLNLGTAPVLASDLAQGMGLHVVAADAASGRIRIYDQGPLLLPAAEGKLLSRIQHRAPGGTGSDGGALIDEMGRLVGIATSGTDRRSDAIPAYRIGELIQTASGNGRETHRAIGRAYRRCIDAQRLMPRRRARLSRRAIRHLSEACDATGNTHLLDGAARILGRAGHVPEARKIFARALALDPHALNSRIGLVTMLHLSGGHAEALPHIKWLLEVLPADTEVMRLAVQAGKLGGDIALAERILKRLERLDPALALPLGRFLSAPLPNAREQR